VGAGGPPDRHRILVERVSFTTIVVMTRPGDREWRECPDGYVPIEDRGAFGWIAGECRGCGPRYTSYVKTPGGGRRFVCRRCTAEWMLDGTRVSS
jgi:hypothetical protein